MKKLSSVVQLVVPGIALLCSMTADDLAASSQSPYTPIQGREIKALSQEQIEGYESGQGMGFALAAELNGYPGPKHVLEFQSELNLTAAQLQSTERAFAEMRDAAEDLGRQIVTQERELDRLFASHALDGEGLASQVMQIAELQGRLRVAHLRAHLELMEILDEDQIARYTELRGYHGVGHSGHRPAGGHGEDR